MSSAPTVSPRSMFGRIAGVYDFLNHFLSLGIDLYWRRELARLVRPGKTGIVLDLAAGTLDVALAIHRAHPQALVPALDFCEPMLARGARKLRDPALKRKILPAVADALRLPLRDESADCVTMAFGIRNIPARAEAFAEMRRVLTRGGRVCILEFGSGRERVWGGVYNFYLNRALPLLGRFVSRDERAYSYLAETIGAFPNAAALACEMEQAGFAEVRYRKLTNGIVCLHWGEKP